MPDQTRLRYLKIALIVFGPRKLPEIGKSLGKMMAEFRKASNDFKQTIESEVERTASPISAVPSRAAVKWSAPRSRFSWCPTRRRSSRSRM